MPFFPPEKSSEIFSWGDIHLLHHEDVFKVGTDAILLGSWVSRKYPSPDYILDVGCGTGILALMMAQVFSNAKIDAIDIHPEAVKLTNENFMKSNWKLRLQVRAENVLQYDAIEKRYDLIILNPPYYSSDHIVSNKESKSISRHIKDSHLTWMRGLHCRLTEGGEIRMVIPHPQANYWITAGNQLQLYAVERVNIFSFEKDVEAKRTLLCFRNVLTKPALTQLILYDSPDVPSEQYRTFISIGLS